MTEKSSVAALNVRYRTIVCLAIVTADYFLEDALLVPFFHLLRNWLGIAPSPIPHTLVCASYVLLATLRLTWWLALTGIVALVDRRGIVEFLHLDRRQASLFFKGLAIGLAVMIAIILTIVAAGDATIHLSAGPVSTHVAYGTTWLVGEIVGAAGEELLFRGLILILVARLLGISAALLISALAFSFFHGVNPGASYIWMARLAAAGILLAYSVVRSGTLWWAIGYHAGWNFGSAPLFGAAGSGYLNQEHIFSFLPSGPTIITGGPVGPEGSALAFIAVIVATYYFSRRSRDSSLPAIGCSGSGPDP